MKEYLLKIWKDSVWSKVISAGIIATIVFIYSKVQNISIWSILSTFHKYGGTYILVGVLSVLIYKFCKTYTRNSKRKELENYNQQEDRSSNLLAKWKVLFDEFEKPYIVNLTMYCTNHRKPLKMFEFRCTNWECKNYKRVIDIRMVKNHIESDLEDMWDNINRK